MNIELKPCPFCGGKAEARQSPNSRSEEGVSFYEVRCKICGVHVTGESFNFWVTKYNKEKPQDLLSAVEAWNKRAYEEDGRKTGKWICEYPGKKTPVIDKNGKVQESCFCSECGDWLTASDEYDCRGYYCPNCGAKMEVDE